MLERVQHPEDNKQHPPVENAGSLVSASAKPVKQLNPAEIIKTLGMHHDRVVNEIADSLNHILHHVSVLQRCLNKQSKLLTSQNPPAALHIFGEADITIQGLFSNINHFADKLGLPRNKIIANQEEPEKWFQKTVLDEAKIGTTMNLKDIATITTKMTIEYLLRNLKVFDMRLLIKSMKWNNKLTLKLDPNNLLNRVLMFTCNHTSGLHHQ